MKRLVRFLPTGRSRTSNPKYRAAKFGGNKSANFEIGPKIRTSRSYAPRPTGIRLVLGRTQSGRCHVPAVQLHNRLFATQRARIKLRSKASTLPRQQRKIIVFPKDRSKVFPVLAASDPQMHHERDRVTRIRHSHLNHAVTGDGVRVQLYLWKRVKPSEISKLRLRRVYRVLLLRPIESVRLGR